ncbi:MAG: ArsR/SmtB family transcription factor [Nitrososphaeraceae archaeon]
MSDPNTKRLLWFIFAGLRGGENRIKIIDILNKNPQNINQISEKLGLDYKSVQHHIKVLEKNNIITKIGDKYGKLYFLSNYMENHIQSFYEIKTKLSLK